jgi:prepilin-type N-terminal cleavage/methylation domain-containing protein
MGIMMKPKYSRYGFTIIEIIIVIAIIGLVAAVAVPSYLKARQTKYLRDDMGMSSEEITALNEDYDYDEIDEIIESGGVFPSGSYSLGSKNESTTTVVPTLEASFIYKDIKMKDGETSNVNGSKFTALRINDCQYIVVHNGGNPSIAHAGLCDNIKHLARR